MIESTELTVFGSKFMSPTLASLGIDQLSVDQRIVLVQEIWDSIAREPCKPLASEAQRKELQRRLADHLANPDDVIPWEQVERQTLARLALASLEK